MSVKNILPPSFAIATAVARPIPLPAPVIKTFNPLRISIASSFPLSSALRRASPAVSPRRPPGAPGRGREENRREGKGPLIVGPPACGKCGEADDQRIGRPGDPYHEHQARKTSRTIALPISAEPAPPLDPSISSRGDTARDLESFGSPERRRRIADDGRTERIDERSGCAPSGSLVPLRRIG
jgi:hypothetical protein